MDYDPNLVSSGRMAKQKVRLTFGLWEYRKTAEVEVGGNCTGLSVIDCAVGVAHDQLEERHTYTGSDMRQFISYSVITMEHMSDPNRTLESSDDDLRGEDWLKDMLVSAEIIGIEPDSKW